MAEYPPRAVIPLHSHTDAEIFYVTEGTLEVFQDDGISSGWQTVNTGEVVTIAGGVKHALRNPSSTMVMTVLPTIWDDIVGNQPGRKRFWVGRTSQ